MITKRWSRVRRLSISLFATVMALCIVLFTSISAFASTVNVNDAAGVLNVNQIQNEGAIIMLLILLSRAILMATIPRQP